MTKKKRTRKDSQAVAAYSQLSKTANIVSTEVHRPLGRHKLTVSQFGVLEALYKLGPMYQRDLAREIVKTTGNITTVIDNLEKNDLVRREREAKDRRYFMIVLTEKGEKLIKKIYPAHAKQVEQVMKRLTKAEQERLQKLCEKLEGAE
jgi:MarR family 2-MHQ and catechol resistance regulon transcriptional repressor